MNGDMKSIYRHMLSGTYRIKGFSYLGDGEYEIVFNNTIIEKFYSDRDGSPYYEIYAILGPSGITIGTRRITEN